MSRVRRVLLGDRREDAVLAHGLVLVLRDRLADLLERVRTWEAREVVELRRQERVLVADLEIGEELLRRRLVRSELPDPPAAHHVLITEPAVRATRDRPDPKIVRERQAAILRRPRRGDRVEDHRALPGVEEVVVAGGIPPEDLVGLASLVDVG